MTIVALTGASGYVGSLIAAGLPPTASLVRLVRTPSAPGDIAWTLDEPDPQLGATLAQSGATDLVHAAWDMSTSAASAAHRVCVGGSLALLRAAKAAGIRRVIFISTISAFQAARSIYGRTKLEVEHAVLAEGGIVLRLGLVHGQGDGGMFGTIRRSVRGSRVVPMIGSGQVPQYLLDASRLQAAVRRALDGDLDAVGRPITLADAHPVPFRDLVTRIAQEERRRPILVPVPWRVLHAGLAAAERLGMTPPVRSDSVVSFVHADPTPDFTSAHALGL